MQDSYQHVSWAGSCQEYTGPNVTNTVPLGPSRNQRKQGLEILSEEEVAGRAWREACGRL